jgi:Protein of unknown function (DUF1236)
MRNRQNILLVGAAAAALLAGTGLVSAQNAAKDQGGAAQAQGVTPSSSTEPGKLGTTNAVGKSAQGESKMSEHAQSDKPSADRAAQDEKTASPSTSQKGAAKNEPAASRSAQDINRGAKGDQQSVQRQEQKSRATAQRQTFNHRSAAAANEHREQGRAKTAERKERSDSLKGLHADTTKPIQGADVQLNDQQRTKIRDTVIDAHGAPRVGHVDFDVRVGTVVPRRDIHVVRVPETLVQIEPEWRGFLYFVYEDEVVVVNPRDMRIVAVLTV